MRYTRPRGIDWRSIANGYDNGRRPELERYAVYHILGGISIETHLETDLSRTDASNSDDGHRYRCAFGQKG